MVSIYKLWRYNPVIRFIRDMDKTNKKPEEVKAILAGESPGTYIIS